MTVKINIKLFWKSLFLSFMVFALLAAIIIAYSYGNIVSFEPLSKESTVLVGITDNNRILSLAVVNIKPSANQILICKIEDNTVISDGIVLQSASSPQDTEQLIHTVRQLVGRRIDRYLLLPVSSLASLNDKIGSFNFFIPYTFVHKGEEYSGNHQMNGEVALSMLTYSKYDLKSVSYSEIALAYFEGLLAQYADSQNTVSVSDSILNFKSAEQVYTDMNDGEIRDYCEALADNTRYEISRCEIRGRKETTSSSVFFIPDKTVSEYDIFK